MWWFCAIYSREKYERLQTCRERETREVAVGHLQTTPPPATPSILLPRASRAGFVRREGKELDRKAASLRGWPPPNGDDVQPPEETIFSANENLFIMKTAN